MGPPACSPGPIAHLLARYFFKMEFPKPISGEEQACIAWLWFFMLFWLGDNPSVAGAS
jgi:hypothetical protein